MEILRFKDFLIEQNSMDDSDEKEIEKLDKDITDSKMELKKKNLEILKKKKEQQDKDEEYQEL